MTQALAHLAIIAGQFDTVKIVNEARQSLNQTDIWIVLTVSITSV